jgi:hypothetical protein
MVNLVQWMLYQIENIRIIQPYFLAFSRARDADETWPGHPTMTLATLAARSPWLRLGRPFAPALEIERHCSADEILKRRLIDLVAFVDVDGAPDIPVKAGVE